MGFPTKVTFRDIDHSPALEAYVRQRADKLETFSDRIVGCRVVIESPHRHKSHGRHFHVHVDLTVPGGDVVVSHDRDGDRANEDAYAAIDETFDRVGRQLEDHVRRQRGDVKGHRSR